MLAALWVFCAVLGALLFNLISDLTGGIRLTVIDEDLIVAPPGARPGPLRVPPPAPARAARRRAPDPSTGPTVGRPPAPSADPSGARRGLVGGRGPAAMLSPLPGL